MSDLFTSPTIDLAPNCEIEYPPFVSFPAMQPPDTLQKVINQLQLERHVENGYFKETDRSPFTIDYSQSEYPSGSNENPDLAMPTRTEAPRYEGKRSYSTMIYYLLTPDAPITKMIMNRSRNIHVLQKGKGQYVLVYPDGTIKSFKVGFDYENGEVSQWVVPGGVYKASFLLPNEEFDNGMLISEIVVPGFEFSDYKPIPGKKELETLVGEEKAELLKPFL
ncbi:LAFE_0A01398g1_1 [Lachancea fermentati]|uniref:LAFE_0A01398g1_1 n=1 Tax=Lachancea fermentati TaxID=4955 RepID=A0A1G4M6A8_LACFM|nr:LAFE_0A01398g1_1 [Lachancea fermentati]